MCVWSCSPVTSTLCWCGPAACGGRSLSQGPTLWPWSRRHRWPPAARRTGRSAPPPHGPWGRVNTDLSRCPRRAAWRHENHWPPWEGTRHRNTTSQVFIAEQHVLRDSQRWTYVAECDTKSFWVFMVSCTFSQKEYLPQVIHSVRFNLNSLHNTSFTLWQLHWQNNEAGMNIFFLLLWQRVTYSVQLMFILEYTKHLFNSTFGPRAASFPRMEKKESYIIGYGTETPFREECVLKVFLDYYCKNNLNQGYSLNLTHWIKNKTKNSH